MIVHGDRDETVPLADSIAWAAPRDPDVERLWAGIHAGIRRKPSSRRWIPAAAISTAAAAAMALFVVPKSRPMTGCIGPMLA